MSSDITIAAVIGALGAISGAIITGIVGPLITRRLQSRRNRISRQSGGVPDILGTWDTSWYVGERQLHGGRIIFEDWIDSTHVAGHGYGRSERGYIMTGEIDASRVFVGTYKSKDYPTIGFIGAAVLEVSLDTKEMSGTWTGRTSRDVYVTDGRVTFKRIT